MCDVCVCGCEYQHCNVAWTSNLLLSCNRNFVHVMYGEMKYSVPNISNVFECDLCECAGVRLFGIQTEDLSNGFQVLGRNSKDFSYTRKLNNRLLLLKLGLGLGKKTQRR